MLARKVIEVQTPGLDATCQDADLFHKSSMKKQKRQQAEAHCLSHLIISLYPSCHFRNTRCDLSPIRTI